MNKYRKNKYIVIGDLMSKVWSYMFIISILYLMYSGNPQKMMPLVMTSIEGISKNIIILIGSICFWNGIFNILRQTKIINILKNAIKPIIKIIFKQEKDYLEEKDYENLSVNILSNVIGIGNAGTVSGLNVMENFNLKNNKSEKASNLMTKFVFLNTISLQLIPVSIISLRTFFDSKNPNIVLVPIIVISITSLIIGLLIINYINRKVN